MNDTSVETPRNPLEVAQANFDAIDLTVASAPKSFFAHWSERRKTHRDLRRRIKAWNTARASFGRVRPKMIEDDRAARARIRSAVQRIDTVSRAEEAVIRKHIRRARLRIAMPYILITLAVFTGLALAVYGLIALIEFLDQMSLDPQPETTRPLTSPAPPTSSTPGGHPMQGGNP